MAAILSHFSSISNFSTYLSSIHLNISQQLLVGVLPSIGVSGGMWSVEFSIIRCVLHS